MAENKAKRVIEELDTHEVSLVNRAANRRTFLVFKKADDEPEGQVPATEEIQMTEETLNSVLKAELDGEAEIDKMLEEAKVSEKGTEAVKSTLKILAAYKEDLPEGIVRKLAALAGYKEPPVAPKVDDGEGVRKEDILAKVPEEYKEQIEKLWKQNEETAEKADSLAKALDEERDLRKTATFVKKAAESYEFLPTTAEEFGPILKAIDEKLPEHKEKLEELFNAANEAINKSKALEKISSPGHVDSDGTAYGKLQGIAKELVTKGDAKTEAEAFVTAVERNPGLYDQYLKEQRRS